MKKIINNVGLKLVPKTQNNYIKSWPTFKIIEILDSYNGCSITGKDFQHLIPELEEEYYRRMRILDEENTIKLIKEYEFIQNNNQNNFNCEKLKEM